MNLPDDARLGRLPELEKLRGSTVLVYHGLIDPDAPRVCYEYLRGIGRVPRLDLVLATNGGAPAAARRLALLLHGYTDRLSVLVAHRARSAGTLLCLAAHEIVMGPLAELGPLDPQIGSANAARPGEPGVLSSEDLRAFGQLAHEWFGVPEADRLQLFALLAQRVFPGSLGSFYRADKLIRQLADELLRHQLPDAEPGERERIVTQLVDGYHAHDYAITRAQAKEMGLRVTYPDAREEALMWSVLQDGAAQVLAEPDGSQTMTLVAAADFRARRIAHPNGPGDTGPDIRWQMG